MAEFVPILLNLSAIFIAILGVYKGATQVITIQEKLLHAVQQDLDECQENYERLLSFVQGLQATRQGGIDVQGNLNVGRDMVGGDKKEEGK